MKKYSAIVKDKYDDNKIVIIKYQEYRTKAEFIKDLRFNGYAVNPLKVKESDLFDYIINKTDCYKWDWQMKRIPQIA